MTTTIDRPRSAMPLALAVAALAAATTLTSADQALAQGPGTEALSCTDRAWQDLNNCYMSGTGYWHDVACETAFFVDVAACVAPAVKTIKEMI